MAVFPLKFPRKVLLNAYDRTKKTVEWYQFKDALRVHLNSHLRYDNIAGGHYQNKSLFSDCSRDALLFVGKSSEGDAPRRPDGTYDDIPNKGLFTEEVPFDSTVLAFEERAAAYEYGYEEEENFDDPDGEEDMDLDSEEEIEEEDASEREREDLQPNDPSFYARLHAYIPVFVWAYNCLKVAVFRDDVRIKELETRALIQENALRELYGNPILPDMAPGVADINSHFTLGTVASRRKEPHWKSLFDSFVRVPPPRVHNTGAAPLGRNKKQNIGQGGKSDPSRKENNPLMGMYSASLI